ncbi:hypothetical protein EXIGLDRAFT_699978 [Exidia glandulosa HHB12029]|uniref:C2 domain-containing protein n=1 Tax=Exidia glandulosa HHB12029 TaxID=1314781 RepID=A0A165DMT8_EXIGL|nr:hypothetical protein EXIGLDRAFT_699978 [Exidia glandulosa HHB12029]
MAPPASHTPPTSPNRNNQPPPWPMSPVQKRFSLVNKLKRGPTVPNLNAKPEDGEKQLATLRVQVIACRNLLSADSNGKSDPPESSYTSSYVAVTFQHQRQKTPVVSKTLDPHWATKDATFDFPLYKSTAERLGTLLEIVVWDKDIIGKDYLGEIAIPASKWFERNHAAMHFERAESFWIDLDLRSSRSKNKTASGSVHLKIGFVHPSDSSPANFQNVFNELSSVGGGMADLFSAPATAGVGTVGADSKSTLQVAQPEDEKAPRFRINWEGTTLDYSFGLPSWSAAPAPDAGILLLELRRATDLPKQKQFAKHGWDMDPFVLVSTGAQAFRTRVIRHSLSPHWDERLVLAVSPSEKVHLRVMDWDRISSDDVVGEAWLEVTPDDSGPGLQEKTIALSVDYEKGGFDAKSASKAPALVVATKFESHVSLRRRYFTAHLPAHASYTTAILSSYISSDLGIPTADFETRLHEIVAVHGGEPFDKDEAVQVLLELWGAPTVTKEKENGAASEYEPSVYETADDETPTATRSHSPAPAPTPEPHSQAVTPAPEPTVLQPTHVTFEIAGHALTTWGDVRPVALLSSALAHI